MKQNDIMRYDAAQLQKLNNVISITNMLLEIDLRKLHIIHLDDHRIFQRRCKTMFVRKNA